MSKAGQSLNLAEVQSTDSEASESSESDSSTASPSEPSEDSIGESVPSSISLAEIIG